MLIRKNDFEVEKVGRKNSVIWNHKDSKSIHVDPNHTKSNQSIQDNLTNIVSISDSSDICAIEKILSLLVHWVHTPYLVPTTGIFTYGTASDPRSPSHEPSTEIVTHKGNHTLRNKPPNLLPNVPDAHGVTLNI